MTTSAPPTWPPANRGTASLARNPASPSSTPASGDFTEPVDGRHVGDALRFSPENRRERKALSRHSTTALEGRGVPSVVAADAVAHGVLGEERVRLPVVLPERNEHVVVGDQALGTGRELRQKSRRLEDLVERSSERRDAREEIRQPVAHGALIVPAGLALSLSPAR